MDVRFDYCLATRRLEWHTYVIYVNHVYNCLILSSHAWSNRFHLGGEGSLALPPTSHTWKWSGETSI